MLANDLSPISLADALETVLRSKPYRLELAKRALQAVRDFSADAVADKMLALYNQVITRRGPL